MAKNNGGKVIQMLSPENYIRKKARTLPLFECMVNNDWEDSQLAQLSIARKHTNGNITVCFYLVDLLCLGVKDTHFMFNISPFEYKESLDQIREKMDIMVVAYPIVHNIILAGIDFAEEYGFKPHKEYTSTTQFMLEEDSEDIELIEIECGSIGGPVYYRGPFDDDAKMKRIISKLEKTAGKGNFTIVDEEEDFDEEDEDIDEVDFDDDDEFSHLSLAEKKVLFFKLFARFSKLSDEETRHFSSLVDSIVYNLTDNDLYDQYCDDIFEDVFVESTEDEIPDELLGIVPGAEKPTDGLKERFIEIYDLIPEDLQTAKKLFKEFREHAPGVPGTSLLELQILQIEKPSCHTKRLKELYKQYPDYQILKVLWAIEEYSINKSVQQPVIFPLKLNLLFNGRNAIHPIEMHFGLVLYFLHISLEADLNKIEAFGSVLYDLDLPEKDVDSLELLIALVKIEILANILSKQK